MLTTVMLYGDMGRKFGKRWRLDIASPAEAIRALMANRPDLRAWLEERRDHPFRVLVGNDPEGCNEDQLFDPLGGQTLKFIPVVGGAKEAGAMQTIVGIVLVIAGAIMRSPTVIKMGVLMIIGGVSQMLFAPPRPGDPPEKPDNKPSYLFSGPVNTTAQGQAVPVLYGKLRVGSAVIYGAIKSEDYTAGGGLGGSGTTGGGLGGSGGGGGHTTLSF